MVVCNATLEFFRKKKKIYIYIHLGGSFKTKYSKYLNDSAENSPKNFHENRTRLQSFAHAHNFSRRKRQKKKWEDKGNGMGRSAVWRFRNGSGITGTDGIISLWRPDSH